MAIVVISVLVLASLVLAVVAVIRNSRQSKRHDAELAAWSRAHGFRYERGPSPLPELDLSLLEIRYGQRFIEHRLWPDVGPDHGFQLRGRGAGNMPDAVFTCALAVMPSSTPHLVIESTFGLANVGERLGLRSSHVRIAALDEVGLGEVYRVSSNDESFARTIVGRNVATWLGTHRESFRSLRIGFELRADHLLVRTRPLTPQQSLEVLTTARELRTLVFGHAG
ncbi:MAG: hypothetical protein ACE37B_12090 [Ilumatobacter sp.]|uniref:hypothetical protein n=1 Tax=Ilumatobacter sp. TaxID=1967498 RepID=UPI00391BE68D